jgi:hypothetical protein
LILFAAGAVIGLSIAAYGLFTAEGTTIGGLPAEDVALVNGRHILRSDFIAQTEITLAKAFEDTSPEERRSVLNDMINEELLVQRGLEVDLAASDADVRGAMVIGVNVQVTADIASREPTDQELRAYYDANPEKYAGEGTMQIVDLFIQPTDELTSAQAGDTLRMAGADLRAGMPIDTVMAKYDLMDAEKVDRGETFDFAAKIRLGAETYDVASRLQSGEVSEPFVLKGDINGVVHILYMIARRPAIPREFDEARDTVLTDYKRDTSRATETENINYLKSRAEIVVAPEFQQ